MRDIPGSYGTTNRSHIPASYIQAGIAELDPTVSLPGLRRVFDVNTDAGRAAHAAFHAARDRNEADKEAAISRAAIKAAVPLMRAEIARIVGEGCQASVAAAEVA
ncbi:MAG: hypothetical protein ABII76_26720 [Pseudomonadota bacterium]